jgi:hypothetical protein
MFVWESKFMKADYYSQTDSKSRLNKKKTGLGRFQ